MPTLSALARYLLPVLLLSCTPTKKPMLFSTTPAGADIYVNGKKLPFASPVSSEVDQQHDVTVTAMKEGYELKTTTVPTQVSRWRSWLWTRHDPDTRYIDIDAVSLTLKKIPTLESVPDPAESIELPPFDPSIKLPLIPVGGEGVELIKKED